MAVRFKFPTILFAGLLLGSCADEGEPQVPRDLSEDTSSSTGSRDDEDEDEDDAEGADSDEDEDADASDDDADDDSNAEDEDAEDDGEDAEDDGEDAEDDDAGAADDDDEGSAEDEDEVAASCDELTYEDFGETFVDTYCIACHTGDKPVGGFTLDTLDEIEEHKAEIIERVVVEEDMPPKNSKAPTAGEREMLEAWLDCGPE